MKKIVAELKDNVEVTVLIVHRKSFVGVTFRAPVADVVLASSVFVRVLQLNLVVALAFAVVAVYVIDVFVAENVA